MKKLSVRLSLIFFVLFFLINTKAFAITIDGTYDIENDVSENFKEWQKLSDEEKSKTVMPNVYDITSIKKEYNSFYSRTLRLFSVGSTLDSRYRLDEDISITVKNQKDTAECWAFSLNSALESNISLTTSRTSDIFSTRHMNYYCTKDFLGFNRTPGDGGNPLMGMAYYVSGNGPVLESDIPFQNNDSSLSNLEESELTSAEVQKHIEDYVKFTSIEKEITSEGIKYTSGEDELSEENVNSIREEIKTHIKKYGGITAYSLEDDLYPNYYNNSLIKSSTAFYCDNNELNPNHQVTIIGWDDNYSKDNFNKNCRPIHDGAYIALNSYGEDSFDNGYIYISYDDVFVEQALFGIQTVSEVDYDNIYQYDELGATGWATSDSNIGYGANVFNREDLDGEYLTEVGIYLMNYSKVQVYINNNGDLIEPSLMIEGTDESETLSPGYHVLDLKNGIKIDGDKYTIVVKYIAQDEAGKALIPAECPIEGSVWSDAHGEKGESYISTDGLNWKCPQKNYTYVNVSIKGFSVINNDYDYDYVVDGDYITGISPNTTVEIFKNNINMNVESIESESIIRTSDIITVDNSDGTKKNYTLIVKGDIDCNGKANMTDLASLKRYQIGKNSLNEIQLKASDVTLDGNINMTDVSKFMRYLIGKEDF